ncbi:MAG: hypothetical protein CVV64_15350 [Candidatus Wallbacteria bacterium HGW-Wallbacteria-1]|jgi:DNA-binding response OmpR family regulator|uniref:Response regulatory domain-containing protein n=1 Tax=Candidatus Wallbacteria bacterium HGW-Wallbacteria-1 TaxID=2013854 RepID=A0A2N1PLG3_9BACT|nr:MAG: hypothetical protein CVV64_15350 [Candidatus Wallbacteria bacterium HGW-Wallbacteria-1]
MPKLLMVDDEPQVLELLKEMCYTFDFDFQAFGSGFEALSYLEHNRDIDAIILDVMMPGIDGYQVCSKLKLNRDFNRIPIILLTALDNTFQKVKGFRVGADEYVTKPFDLSGLVDTVRKCIDENVEKKSRTHIEFVIGNEISAIREINNLISDIIFNTCFSQEGVADLQICFHEICYNALEHGNKFDVSKRVYVNCDLCHNRIELKIRDEGDGFYLSQVADPTDDENIFKPRGRGLYLTRKLMDEVSVDRNSCTVKFIKYITNDDTPLPLYF